MIFYFSATGNSRYTAKRIAQATGDSTLSIGGALRGGTFNFDLSGERRLGFIMPTFAWTLPYAAALFIEKTEFNSFKGKYVFAVFTCGESSGRAPAALRELLNRKGVGLIGSFELVMPDNFIFWTPLPAPDRINQILDTADQNIAEIIAAVMAEKTGHINGEAPEKLYLEPTILTPAESPFYATDKCTGCGICAERCPMRCISLIDNKPVWKGECTQCLACLHLCPTAAIEHGKDALGKRRYQNPRA